MERSNTSSGSSSPSNLENRSSESKDGLESPSLDVDKEALSAADHGVATLPHGTASDFDAGADNAYTDVDIDIPLRYRFLAFSMILFFATGSSFMQAIASPLKSTFKAQLGITNAQYGTISSASSLVNTILPIIGGIGMDYWGATYAALISSVFILAGAIIAAISSNVTSYGTLVSGLIIMGFGSTVIESTQSKLYAHWFKGSSLAFVFALDIAWSRITSVFSKASAVPMSEIDGWWGWALWIPTIVCAVNMGLVIMYWWFERAVPKAYRPKLGKDARVQEGWDKRRFSLTTLWRLPKFFWIFCGTQMFQNACVSVYSSNLADIQTYTRGTSKLAAGYNTSLQGVIPIVLTPVTGLFFDRVGWRMPLVSWTAMLYILVFSLINFTTVHPVAPILVSSFALTTNAIVFIASIPILVGDDALLGTAFGVWKAFANANSIVLDVAAGAIQDRTANGSYDNVMYLIIAIKCLQVCLGPVYDYIDGRWLGHSLRMPEKKRVALRKEALDKQLDYPGWTVDKRVTYIVGTQLSCLVIIAWWVYIVYSLGT